MKQTFKSTLSFNLFQRVVALLTACSFIFGCNAQSSKKEVITPVMSSDSIHFIAHLIETNPDGSKAAMDTLTGYRKYYYKNGKLQMEGKVVRDSPKDYRDGSWKYYNEQEQLMRQETYTKQGKINERAFTYFINGKPMSETYQYYEGDYTDKASFKFHKIDKLFYTNGQVFSERHSVNGSIFETKCWDAKGNPQPLEYMNTVKSMSVED